MWVYSAVLFSNAPEVKFGSGPKLNFKYRLCCLLRHELKPEQALYYFNYVSLRYFSLRYYGRPLSVCGCPCYIFIHLYFTKEMVVVKTHFSNVFLIIFIHQR